MLFDRPISNQQSKSILHQLCYLIVQSDLKSTIKINTTPTMLFDRLISNQRSKSIPHYDLIFFSLNVKNDMQLQTPKSLPDDE